LDTGLLKQLGKIESKEKIRLLRKFFIYLIFLALSVVFWLLVVLSKDYTDFIEYPVYYANFPSDKVLLNKLPEKIIIRANAYGFVLLRNKIYAQIHPLVIDVSPYIHSSKSHNNFFIPAKKVEEKLSDQIGSELKILEIKPDTLYFSFVPRVHKRVPIRTNLKIEPDARHMIQGALLIKPRAVILSGPHKILDTIKYVTTLFERITGLNHHLKKSLVVAPIDQVSISPGIVEIEVNVEKFTEGKIIVPVEVVNVPPGMTVKTFPSTINISYLVGLSEYKNIGARHFRAVADFNDIDKDKQNGQKLEVTIIKQPHNISSMKFYPKNVEYLIEK
jgi:hypothetical protein